MSKNSKNTDDICPECGKDPCACESEPTGQEIEDGCPKVKVDEECDKCGQKDGCKRRKGMMDGCKPKADGAVRVDRVDYWGPLNESVRETRPFKETPEGFYQGKAAVTCTGVFSYLQPDGSVRNEFIPPEEVFNEESLESLKMKPLTNGHPKEKVRPDNYTSVTVGSLDREIEHDAYNVYAGITINDAKAIEDAKAGRTGLSCGYSTTVIESGSVSYPVMGYKEDRGMELVEIGRTVYKVPGNIGGVHYDAIQTKRVYNHVALVDVPRGGDALHLRFDSADAIGVRVQPAQAHKADGTTPQLRTGGEPMIKIRLDGAVEHEVPEPVKLHIDAQDAKIQALESEKSTIQAKADSAEQLLASEKKARNDEAAAFQGRVDAAVQSRIALVSLAAKHGTKADGTDDEIRHALIAKALPEAKLDGKDANYVQAMFDAAILHMESQPHADGLQRQSVSDGIPKAADKADSVEAKFSTAWKNQ